MIPAPATFQETAVARVTGVPKKRIAETRKTALLVKGEDWDVENSCVVYSPAGLKKLCAALGVDSALLTGPAESPPSGPEFAQTQASALTGDPSATPSSPQFPPGAPPATNPPWPELQDHPAAAAVAAQVQVVTAAAAATLVQIVVARVAPNPRIVFGRIDGRAVVVAVRDNRHFRPGMQLKAQHATGDYFHMVGHCPRFPGRW